MPSPGEIYGVRWSEKEYLIVLDHYLRHRREVEGPDTPAIEQLSNILGRTSHSILYRLQNFASVDPEETDPKKKSRLHLSQEGRRLFKEWSKKAEALREVAAAFLRDEKGKMKPDLFNPTPRHIPVTFENYEMLDEIGHGGFGIVFSCLHIVSGEAFALKVIDGAKLKEQDCVHRFLREIRALKSIIHPNVIRIFADNLDREREFPGFVMELAVTDLAKCIAERRMVKRDKGRAAPLDPLEAQKVMRSMFDAVSALHESPTPMLHRDINPTNILRLEDGRWVLADFSLAKFLPPTSASSSYLTSSGVGMGTAHYAAPEQYSDMANTDCRADVYSLGWVLRELFTTGDPYYPRPDVSGLPQALDAVFQKAISHEKSARFDNVRDLQVAFEKAWCSN